MREITRKGREFSHLGVECDIRTRADQRDDDARNSKEADFDPEYGTFPVICGHQRESKEWPNIAVRVNGEGDEQQGGEMERRDRGARSPGRERGQRQQTGVRLTHGMA